MIDSFERFEVEISGIKYEFSNQIEKEKNLFESFNKLSNRSFGISFDHVGGQYEPHVLALDGRVCSNVSVNQIPFNYRGERKLFIQLGTVMTDPELRNRGLSRWLIDYIIDHWENRSDAIYLFANDSVLDFYPKFGFVPMSEFEYKRTGMISKNTNIRKLNMNDERDVHLVLEKFEQGNPFSSLYMMENQGLLMFYCMGIMKENIYYSPKYDVVMILQREHGMIQCCDIFGTTSAELNDILEEIPSTVNDEIVLGFTPINTDGFLCQMHCEEDTTLFRYRGSKTLFHIEKSMFPVISHA